MTSKIPQIRGVRVQSGIFSGGYNIDLFNDGDKPRRISIIFGHNGSGKSTVAREIEAIKLCNSDGFFYGPSNQPLDLEDADRVRIRVFSEEYIESKISINEDGLEAFAMLGEQVEAANEIKKIDEQINNINAENDELTLKINNLSNGKNSPEALIKEAKDAVKNGGWGSRAEQIDGTSPSLTPKRWDKIYRSSTGVSRAELEKQFNSKLIEYKRASEAGPNHLYKLFLHEIERYNETGVIDLLAKRVEDPTLSARERHILELELVEESARVFSQLETDVCPMCQREVSQQEKNSIVDSVRKVLNKEVDAFKEELRKAHLKEISHQDAPEQITDSLRSDLYKAEVKVNELVNKYNELIEERESNIYSPKSIEPLGLSEALQSLNGAINRINEDIISINKDIDEKTKIHENLLKLNNAIAFVDARTKIEESKQASKELNDAVATREKHLGDLRDLAENRNAQEARARRVDIAVDVINSYLANVYFDAKKFQLHPDGDKYKIISNGHAVMPKDVSTGERNILALCYFFSEGGKDRQKNHEDDDPQYLVLDDPISSFDLENRIGVCSLIRERSEHILISNAESRITVMTHDWGVVEELLNIFKDMKASLDGENPEGDLLEIRDRRSEKCKERNGEYTVLLKRAYDFAAAEDVDANESLIIGNILRRVLEGYSTFNYGIGMAQLSRDPDLRQRFGDKLPFLEYAMYRLALNDASHMEMRIKTFNPALSIERYSDEEKRRCAQCVMVILGKLDLVHLQKLLGKCDVEQQDIESHLREWSDHFAQETL
jgi:hypothetical protein